jgi:dTDP-4-amino-4,6-dideoxygalactose transaminase
VLSEKLPYLLRWNEQLRAVAAFYRDAVADLNVTVQRHDPDELHAYHLFVLRTTQRDDFLTALRANGIDAVVRYPHPIHLQPPFAAYGWRGGEFPVAEALAKELLCLPLRPDLPPDEQQYVIDQVRACDMRMPA